MADEATDRREVVVITGASAGLGRATARRFASAGARVGLIARGADRLERATEEISNLGGTAIAVEADVASREQVEAAADRIENELGPIDVWVNNAAVTVFGQASAIRTDEFERITDVNYLGAVWGTLAAVGRMTPRGRGRIIQVCSSQAIRGLPLESAFAGASHALRGFTDSIRAELNHGRTGVRVSTVIVPALNTPRYQWSRNHTGRAVEPSNLYEPEVAAQAIHWMARHDRRELALGWETLGTAVADHLLPEALDAWFAGPGHDARLAGPVPDGEQKDNLFESVEGNFAAHGALGARAAKSNTQLLASQHRGLVLGGLGLLAILALLKRR